MEEIAKILANYGFPIAVASFLLVRMEKRMESLEMTIKDLIIEIKQLSEKKEK